jgi:hypothetical protein
MNVEIGAEAAQFPEKEYISGFSLQCRMTKNFASVLDVQNLCTAQLADPWQDFSAC